VVVVTKCEIFDRVWAHYITERQPLCVIRREHGHWATPLFGQNGERSPIALFIPNGKRAAAEAADERSGIAGLLADGLLPGIRSDAVRFLQDLDAAHDSEAVRNNRDRFWQGYWTEDKRPDHVALGTRLRSAAWTHRLPVPPLEALGL
jgi:hypothetical protein